MLVNPNERIDDLQLRGLKIIQNPDSFCFGTDAVLLADFAFVKAGANVADLGTGTGILPLLLYGRHEYKHCDAVEIQPDMAEMATRSIQMNELEEKITIHCGDLRRVKEFLPSCAYSTVVCNPPYKKAGCGMPNSSKNRALSRHELTCTIDDVCAAAAYLLKYSGRLAIINHCDRLVDIFECMRNYDLEPKRCRLIQARPGAKANTVLVEAVKGGKPYMTWDPTLCIYNEHGELSSEVKTIYNGSEKP